MKTEKVFEILAEGSELIIWKITDNSKTYFIYNHSEYDPTDSGLGSDRTGKYDSFRKPFNIIHKKYDWHIFTLEFVHVDYREYVTKKLIGKLNQKNQRAYELHSLDQFETALQGYLLEEFDKVTDTVTWSFSAKLTPNQSNQIILKELNEVAYSLNPEISSYFIIYPHFLNYFKHKSHLDLSDVVLGISFVYSWMPTILKSLDLNKEDTILQILNRAKKGDDLSKKELAFLKSIFNNSLVGTSKLLHFINPEKFAIWDSRVFRNLCKEEPHKYKLEKPEAYLSYLTLLNELKQEMYFGNFHKLMIKKVGYYITPLRALELGIFYK